MGYPKAQEDEFGLKRNSEELGIIDAEEAGQQEEDVAGPRMS